MQEDVLRGQKADKPATQEERRANYRVRLSCRVQIYLLDRVTDNASYTDVSRTALVEDISLGGVLLWVSEKMEIDSLFLMEFSVMGKEKLLTAQVVRGADEKNGQFCYGCRFVDATQRQIDDLYDELVRVQRFGLGQQR